LTTTVLKSDRDLYVSKLIKVILSLSNSKEKRKGEGDEREIEREAIKIALLMESKNLNS
jgi:hypothetical protein